MKAGLAYYTEMFRGLKARHPQVHIKALTAVEVAHIARIEKMSVRDCIVPPTINYQTPDPELDLDYTPNVAVTRPVRAVLSNSFGFGGHNVTLAIKRFEE